jgi:hypothetical protein
LFLETRLEFQGPEPLIQCRLRSLEMSAKK